LKRSFARFQRATSDLRRCPASRAEKMLSTGRSCSFLRAWAP
jgi:hypothetical protein